jgi:hypothetical protein
MQSGYYNMSHGCEMVHDQVKDKDRIIQVNNSEKIY